MKGMTAEESLEQALHEAFPRKHFKVTIYANRSFNIQYHDKSLPLKKIKEVFAERWEAIFGTEPRFGKVLEE